MKSLLRLRNPLTAVKILEVRPFHVRRWVPASSLANTLTAIVRLYSRCVHYDHGRGRDVEMCHNHQRLAARVGH